MCPIFRAASASAARARKWIATSGRPSRCTWMNCGSKALRFLFRPRILNTSRCSAAGWGRHVGVVIAARLVYGARAFDAAAALRGRFGCRGAAQLFVRDGGNFDVDVDAVEQRSADSTQVALNGYGSASALARGIPVEPAR